MGSTYAYGVLINKSVKTSSWCSFKKSCQHRESERPWHECNWKEDYNSKKPFMVWVC